MDPIQLTDTPTSSGKRACGDSFGTTTDSDTACGMDWTPAAGFVLTLAPENQVRCKSLSKLYHHESLIPYMNAAEPHTVIVLLDNAQFAFQPS